MKTIERRVRAIESARTPLTEPVLVFITGFGDKRIVRYSLAGGNHAPIDRQPGESDEDLKSRAALEAQRVGSICVFGVTQDRLGAAEALGW